MLAFTVPNWQTLVVDEVFAANGSPWLILLLYTTHTINNGVHNAAWFVVCELESGVSTGLLMGLKAAALFLASALCFCKDQSPWPDLLDYHKEQCMTRTKAGATAVVLFGTAVYYWPTSKGGDGTVAMLDGKGTELCACTNSLSPVKGSGSATAAGSRKATFKLLGRKPSVHVAEFEALRARVEKLEADNARLDTTVRALKGAMGTDHGHAATKGYE